MNILLALIFLLVGFIEWKNFKSQVQRAENEEETRHLTVRFLLKILLFLLAVIVFIF